MVALITIVHFIILYTNVFKIAEEKVEAKKDMGTSLYTCDIPTLLTLTLDGSTFPKAFERMWG